MNPRILRKDDYHKGYLELLSQLTVVGEITQQDFDNAFERQNLSWVFVIEERKKIIATASLMIEQKFIHHCGRVGHIEDVIVDHQARGLGLGKKIVDHLVDICRINRCYKVILNCHQDNVQFYEKCGFNAHEIEMVKVLGQEPF